MEQNITQPFEIGCELFNTSQMFEYLDRDGLSRHDGLHNFYNIHSLYQESGLSPETIF